jgi:hypothetical protein
MPVEATAAGAAVLEIERFEWTTPERIEIVGYWSGLRGRRFMRPTLVLNRAGETKRLLALLEHKPWSAQEGDPWIAAFAWEGEVTKFDSAELNVGSGIDLDLPSPRMRPGPPRRFKQRVVARDASRQVDTPVASGIVSDAPTSPAQGDEPKLSRAEALRRAREAAVPAKPKPAAEPGASSGPPAADQTETTPDLSGALSGDLEAARTDLERIRGEREALRRERDRALEKLRGVRAELEAERQAREKAVADARSEERATANRMFEEGAELRAAVERQRELAYLERDKATKARDHAIETRDKACEERDGALAEAREARRERKEAFAERDRAIKLRERAEADRRKAVDERDAALVERDEAVKEHDDIMRAHERDLPVHPPKPRFLPEDHERRSAVEIWGPRASALGVLLLCAIIVLRLFACG